MSEVEREEALASRQEEIQRLQDKLNLDMMIKSQNGAVDSDSVYQAAKRRAAFLQIVLTIGLIPI